MKYSVNNIGIGIIKEVENKVEFLRKYFNGKTIQKVLITQSNPSKELAVSGYFYKIINAKEFLK